VKSKEKNSKIKVDIDLLKNEENIKFEMLNERTATQDSLSVHNDTQLRPQEGDLRVSQASVVSNKQRV
jgi:hypothetical protein